MTPGDILKHHIAVMTNCGITGLCGIESADILQWSVDHHTVHRLTTNMLLWNNGIIGGTTYPFTSRFIDGRLRTWWNRGR